MTHPKSALVLRTRGRMIRDRFTAGKVVSSLKTGTFLGISGVSLGLSLCGCDADSLKPHIEPVENHPDAKVFYYPNNPDYPDGSLYITEFKGHKFAIFSNGHGSAMIEIHDDPK